MTCGCSVILCSRRLLLLRPGLPPPPPTEDENLSPIRKAFFPPSGQVQGPQAARWLHSLRVNQTAGKPNPFLPPGDLAHSPAEAPGLTRTPPPGRPVSPACALRTPPARIPRPVRPRPRARAPPATSPPRGARGAGADKAARPRHAPADGRRKGGSPGTPARRPGQGAGSGPKSGPRPTPGSPHKMEPAGRRREGVQMGLRRPLLGFGPGARRRRAGGGLARVPPLLGPAHKDPRRGPAPAPAPAPRPAAPRERPRRRRPGPGPGGRAGGREASGPGRAALAAGTAPGGDGHFIRAKVESV